MKGPRMLQLFVFVQNRLAELRDEERGATAVEYGLMVAAIAAVIIIAVNALGVNVNAAFSKVNTNWKN